MNGGLKIMAEQPDFLQPLLELMQDNYKSLSTKVDGLSSKVDKNTDLTKKVHAEARATNGKVARQEKRIAELENKKHFEPDPKLLYAIAIGSVILLLIIAKLLHVEVGGII